MLLQEAVWNSGERDAAVYRLFALGASALRAPAALLLYVCIVYRIVVKMLSLLPVHNTGTSI